MGRLAGSAALMAVCGIAASCQYVDLANQRAWEEYHTSRWQVVVNACVSFDEFLEPDEPPTPRICEGQISDGYPAVTVAYSILDRDWQGLVNQSGETVAFIAEMLNVLDDRNTLRIETLAPQIDKYVTRQDELKADWRNSSTNLGDRLGELEALWELVWEDCHLDFDLAAGIAAGMASRIPVDGTPRHAALVHYHEAEYTRLASAYLPASQADVATSGKSHIPQGCEELAASLRDLEAGLLVQYSLDRAALKNADTIVELTRVDLSTTPWDEISVPRGHYGDRRVPAAVARLKLLRQLDEILTGSLDVLVREVQLQWDDVWPGCELETNIFAFAQLAPTRQ